MVYRSLATKADSPKTAKMLHAILYTHLIKGELGQAVDFIDSLIMQASVTMATSGEELPVYDDGSRPPLMTLVSHRSQVGTFIQGCGNSIFFYLSRDK